MRGIAIVELRSGLDFASEAWVECLRKAGGRTVEWRLVEMRREQTGSGAPARTLWIAEGHAPARPRDEATKAKP